MFCSSQVVMAWCQYVALRDCAALALRFRCWPHHGSILEAGCREHETEWRGDPVPGFKLRWSFADGKLSDYWFEIIFAVAGWLNDPFQRGSPHYSENSQGRPCSCCILRLGQNNTSRKPTSRIACCGILPSSGSNDWLEEFLQAGSLSFFGVDKYCIHADNAFRPSVVKDYHVRTLNCS